MTNTKLISRRAVLQASVGGAAAWGLAAASASAIEPIARNGTAKIKLSLAAYSYRQLFKSGELTLADFIDDCAAMQLEGTELTSYYFADPVTAEYLHGLSRQCFRLGLDVSGTAIRSSFGDPLDSANAAKEIADVKRWIDHAEVLGAPVIRIFAGHMRKGVDDSKTYSRMVAAIEECCEYAGGHGIHLALENHGGPTDTADGILKFVRDVQSPWFGVNLDSGNFASDDVYGDLARIAPYAINAQVKVAIKTPDGKGRPTDFAKIAKLLIDANYRGYVALEYEEEGDPRIECPKYLDILREAFA